MNKDKEFKINIAAENYFEESIKLMSASVVINTHCFANMVSVDIYLYVQSQLLVLSSSLITAVILKIRESENHDGYKKLLEQFKKTANELVDIVEKLDPETEKNNIH